MHGPLNIKFYNDKISNIFRKSYAAVGHQGHSKSTS